MSRPRPVVPGRPRRNPLSGSTLRLPPHVPLVLGHLWCRRRTRTLETGGIGSPEVSLSGPSSLGSLSTLTDGRSRDSCTGASQIDDSLSHAHAHAHALLSRPEMGVSLDAHTPGSGWEGLSSEEDPAPRGLRASVSTEPSTKTSPVSASRTSGGDRCTRFAAGSKECAPDVEEEGAPGLAQSPWWCARRSSRRTDLLPGASGRRDRE